MCQNYIQIIFKNSLYKTILRLYVKEVACKSISGIESNLYIMSICKSYFINSFKFISNYQQVTSKSLVVPLDVIKTHV